MLIGVAGCVTGTRFQTDVQNKVGVLGERLTRLVEQNETLTNTIEHVDQMQQEFRQQLADKIELFHKDIQAGTIKYGGAGWVVLAAAIIILIFTVPPLIVLYLFIKGRSLKSLLGLVTTAIQNAPPEVGQAVKDQIKHETSNGGPWGIKDKVALSMLTRKLGTYISDKALAMASKPPSLRDEEASSRI